MSKDGNVNIALTKPQRDFVFSDAAFPAIVGGLGCMRGDTQIKTSKGLKSIKDITWKDKVLSWNHELCAHEYSECSSSFIKGNDRLYKVTTTGGEWVASKDHMVLCTDNGYRKVMDLSVGDELNGTILSIEKLDEYEDYYDIQVPGNNNYVSEDGCIHHNSGKTRAGTIRLILKMVSDPGINCAYYLPVYDLLRLRAMPGVQEDLDMLGLKYTTNKSTFTITIEGYGDIIFRSYDNPTKIVAFEVSHSVCDELDLLPKDKASVVWSKISERNRQKC